MRNVRFLRGFAVVAILGVVSFVLAQQFLLTPTSSAGTKESVGRLDTRLAVVEADLAKDAAAPKFSGVPLGIALSPTEQDWPELIRGSQTEATSRDCAPWNGVLVNRLAFNNLLTLPSKFSPAGLGGADLIECEGVVSSANWQFSSKNEFDTPADIYISRSVAKGFTFGGNADRVTTTLIEGRPAIVVAPITPDGLAQTAMVIFPESFGSTLISTFNVGTTDLMSIAVAVAVASK